MINLGEQEIIEETKASSMNLQVYIYKTERETENVAILQKVYHMLFARVLVIP